MRTVEVFHGSALLDFSNFSGTWIPKKFEELKKGDTFKVFEIDGTQVLDSKGNGIFTAVSDVYTDVYTGSLKIDSFSRGEGR